jgi:hypothetical protein
VSTETANSKSSWSHFPHDADIGVVGVGPTMAEAFRCLSPTTTIDELGLSSLECVELMVALKAAFQT